MSVDAETKQITKQSAVNVGVLLTVAAVLVPVVGYQFQSAVSQAVRDTQWKTTIQLNQEKQRADINELNELFRDMRASQRRIEDRLGTLPAEQRFGNYGYRSPGSPGWRNDRKGAGAGSRAGAGAGGDETSGGER